MRTRLIAVFVLGGVFLAASFARPQGPPARPEAKPDRPTQPAAIAASPSAARPATWAQSLQVAGLPNLHKVSDDLYRCAQPTAQGIQNLKSLGIKTVVNLRAFHSDAETVGPTGLGYEQIPMKAWHPEEEEVVRFLRIVSDHKRTPVLVHCQHGADRTGTMCAIYRIAVQGWTKQEAIREMTDGGFGFHGMWENLIQYINKLDVQRIKHKAASKD